jgi:tetratricopeptide (TPR) repeat protein
MSSRALRRLERQREQSLEPVDTPVDSPVVAPIRTKKKNLYAMMDVADSESDHADNDSSSENETKIKEPIKVSIPTKSQKKKKSKKLKAPAENAPTDDDFDQLLSQYGVKPEQSKTIDLADDEDDKTSPLDLSFTHYTLPKQLKSCRLLKIEHKDLDPDNEYLQLFGKLSQEAIDDANSTTSTSIPPEQLAQIKKLARVVRGWGGRDKRAIPGTSRKLVMTKIRDDWIPTPKSDLTMHEIELNQLVRDKLGRSEDWEDVIREEYEKELSQGLRYFKFERSEVSKVISTQFYSSVVLAPNHEALSTILMKSPYHIETILQMALILIRQGDKSNSNGLIERGLFIFDRSFKQSFELGNGLSRFPFNYYLNRQFYLTLFRYVEVLTKKGTYYTAWNYARLLLSLDPKEDPYGVRYFIDFYALISGEYVWLIKFYESALVKTYEEWMTPNLMYSYALALLLNNAENEAKEALKEAFEKYPYLGHKLLSLEYESLDATVEIMTESYLLQYKIIWKEKIEFLINTLSEISGSVNNGKMMKYSSIPENLLRYVILSGEGKIMSKIPSHWWDDNQIYEFDVLPYGETIERFIDHRVLGDMEEQRMMDLVREMSLQEFLDRQ